MAIVYVLLSLKTGKKYVGSTLQNPVDRLTDHNSGKVLWTKAHRPLKLVYFEEFESKEVAFRRELFFKSGKGRIVLKSLLNSRAIPAA